ncbi:alpha/beta fold hydrolase [Nocardia brasiliensis]|uniref:alpha/beta fold hydrolase n=1 Tax=Nocardia brasiliensis TaxID=37326 RepID=UPI0024553DE6|nr:alpha/beta hydrolase [Nocardia brasiliensis]
MRLSYTDFGGAGMPLLALHGSFGRGTIFTRLAADLSGRARVIAPDLRGHGHSDRADSYTCADFVADVAELLQRLAPGPIAVLGHSRGGITAYQLAARHPELVSRLIVEDVGPVMRRPEVEHPVLDVRGWPAAAASKSELAEALRARGISDPGYFMQSAAASEDGRWHWLFDWTDMMAVQEGGVGDWWADWLGSTCPALVLRGEHSPMLPADLAAAMVARRPGARLVEFGGAGHWVHDDAPAAMAETVASFLNEPSTAAH